MKKLIIVVVLIIFQTGLLYAQKSDSTSYFVSWLSYQSDNSISAGNAIIRLPNSSDRQKIWTALRSRPEVLYIISCMEIDADSSLDIHQGSTPAKLEIEYVVISPVSPKFVQGNIRVSCGDGNKAKISILEELIKKTDNKEVKPVEGQKIILTNIKQINY